MTRRGFTLIETLLSVTLLTAVLAAAAAWTGSAARLATRLDAPARWERAAIATVDLVRDDLAVRDAAPASRRGRARNGPVAVVNGELVVTTRHRLAPATGRPTSLPVTHRYRLRSGRLDVIERPSEGVSHARVLLDDVAEARFAWDDATGRLTVELQRASGAGERAVAVVRSVVVR